jgi:hypothetical protein
MNRNNPEPSRLRLFGAAAFLSILWLTIFTLPAVAQDETAGNEEVVVAEDIDATGSATDADPDWSPGMYLPFDGSSVDAFNGSLEAIQEQSTEAEFTTLKNALDYLLVYDLAARRDPEVLYERLNGKTPADVIGMVKWKLRGESDGA